MEMVWAYFMEMSNLVLAAAEIHPKSQTLLCWNFSYSMSVCSMMW